MQACAVYTHTRRPRQASYLLAPGGLLPALATGHGARKMRFDAEIDKLRWVL